MTSRKTRQYVDTAVESLTLAIELFNRPSPVGREYATVMMAAHSFEMLLKAVIYENRKRSISRVVIAHLISASAVMSPCLGWV